MGGSTYSTVGPICPYCDHKHRADEPAFFDETEVEFDCDECGETFVMHASCIWSWTCEELD